MGASEGVFALCAVALDMFEFFGGVECCCCCWLWG